MNAGNMMPVKVIQERIMSLVFGAKANRVSRRGTPSEPKPLPPLADSTHAEGPQATEILPEDRLRWHPQLPDQRRQLGRLLHPVRPDSHRTEEESVHVLCPLVAATA